MTTIDKFKKLAEKVLQDYEDAADWKDAIGEIRRLAREAMSSLQEDTDAKNAAYKGYYGGQ